MAELKKTTFLSQQNLGRVTARAWLYPEFRKEVEIDPVPIIKRDFVYCRPQIFPDFDLLGIISARPDGITDEELRKVAVGEIIALPDRFMPSQDAYPDWIFPSNQREGEEKIYLTQVEWSQITALAWLEPDFKYALLVDPGKAIRERPEFDSFKFERALWVPPPPPGDCLSQEQIEQIANGDLMAIVIPFFTFSDA